eukprot:scaffold70981_cov32-Tisochrysis_lutea.AAC.4
MHSIGCFYLERLRPAGGRGWDALGGEGGFAWAFEPVAHGASIPCVPLVQAYRVAQQDHGLTRPRNTGHHQFGPHHGARHVHLRNLGSTGSEGLAHTCCKRAREQA